MDGLMLPATFLIENLYQTNERLGYWLEQLDSSNSGGPPADFVAEVLAGVLRAGMDLQAGIPEPRDRAMQAEIEAYRVNLQRLVEVLPRVHRRLLEQRAGLEVERARLQSGVLWMEGLRSVR
jgi:hypothetical protein